MPTTLTELAEHWHAPDCTIDAGGGCILHAEEKEAWIAGYESSARERDELRAEVERLRIELHRVAESRRGQRERAERLRAALNKIADDSSHADQYVKWAQEALGRSNCC